MNGYTIKKLLIYGLVWLSIASCSSKPVKINWVSSLPEALQTAWKSKQNILVFFYADWSKWSQVLEDSSLGSSRFAGLKDKIILTKLNAETEAGLVSKYKVSDFPTLILLNSKGEEIDRVVGYLPSKELVNKINNYLGGKETLADFQNRVKKDSSNVNMNFKLAVKYQERSRWNEAEQFYRKVLELDPRNSRFKSDSSLFNLSIVYIKKSDFDKALENLDQLKREFPKSSLVMSVELYRAFCYAKKGDKNKAIALYESFIKQYPKYPHSASISEELKKLKS
jgi:thiol:disulfide interchange protein DsbD